MALTGRSQGVGCCKGKGLLNYNSIRVYTISKEEREGDMFRAADRFSSSFIFL